MKNYDSIVILEEIYELIDKDKFNTILRESESDESFIID